MFFVGDTVFFSWPPSQRHSVFLLRSRPALDSCLVSWLRGVRLREEEGGGVAFLLQRAGYYYFACGVPGHCEEGQRIAIFANTGEGRGGECGSGRTRSV